MLSVNFPQAQWVAPSSDLVQELHLLHQLPGSSEVSTAKESARTTPHQAELKEAH